MRKLVILGSTGSIGTQCLDVVRESPEQFQVVGLATNRSAGLLSQQIEEFHPKAAVVMDPRAHSMVRSRLGKDAPRLGIGLESLVELASHPEADTVVVATVGSVGLTPTLAAVEAGKRVALANKESLVMAGSILKREAAASGALLLPIDSEHSAIFQCLQAGRREEVVRIHITASGGPFRTRTLEQLRRITVADALRHPTWNMGKKITIDSATLLNKGLEIIEGHHFFDLPPEKINVVVHPQSIIHSIVEYCDGSLIAQLGYPDMRIPIRYALGYPERLPSKDSALDPAMMGDLTFEPPDLDRFPCLRLAYESCRRLGTAPTVLVVAGEVAVQAFLEERIAFLDIPRVIEQTLVEHGYDPEPDLARIQEAETWTRRRAEQLTRKGGSDL
jgi:1-deoxy-D-xylulose-5-phosphate reductoisomerase